MKQVAPAYARVIGPEMARKYVRWLQEHADRGCGDPIGSAAYDAAGRLVVQHCRCDCPDHGCADVESVPDCATCRDTGIVAGPRDRDAAGFGKARPCPDCLPEADSRRFEYRQRLFGLDPDLLDGAALTDLDDGAMPRLGAEIWIANHYQPATLVLAGPTGSGKTHTAIGLTRHLLDAGRHVYFTTASELLQSLRETFDRSENRSLEDVLRMPLGIDVLVLDDLGAEKQTEWAHEQLFRVVNHRYSEHRTTIVTTNLLPQTAPRDRLWSRLFGDRFAQIIITHGADRRRED